MSRGLSLFALLLLAVVSFGLYQLSYEVQRLEEELIELNRALSQERETIGVLQAEWSYLSRPEYLQDKAQRLLEMRPAVARDIVAIEALPWRQDRGQDQPAGQPQQPAVPPVAAAPALPPALAAAPAPARSNAPVQVVAKSAQPAAAPSSNFDDEVTAVLGAMQRAGSNTGRAQ